MDNPLEPWVREKFFEELFQEQESDATIIQEHVRFPLVYDLVVAEPRFQASEKQAFITFPAKTYSSVLHENL
jgi:hypothetical protein